jgi:hypothetical protein
MNRHDVLSAGGANGCRSYASVTSDQAKASAKA